MIKILSRPYGQSTEILEKQFEDDQELRAIHHMNYIAQALADELGTEVQEDKDGHLHVVKAINHEAVGKEFWSEEDESGLTTL